MVDFDILMGPFIKSIIHTYSRATQNIIYCAVSPRHRIASTFKIWYSTRHIILTNSNMGVILNWNVEAKIHARCCMKACAFILNDPRHSMYKYYCAQGYWWGFVAWNYRLTHILIFFLVRVRVRLVASLVLIIPVNPCCMYLVCLLLSSENQNSEKLKL